MPNAGAAAVLGLRLLSMVYQPIIARLWTGTMSTIYSDHMRIDERNLAMDRLIAEKEMADPSLIDVAKNNINRLFPRCRPQQITHTIPRRASL